MKLLLKDHKPAVNDGLHKTRPVVGANKGMNVPLSDILSDILEPVARGLNINDEVVSSENMMYHLEELNKEF